MMEARGDIWRVRQPEDFVCVTTNGTLRKDGKLVMVRGIAYEASQKYPWIQKALGELISTHGLKVEVFQPTKLIAFPVKYEFWQKADINLILKSTIQLVELEPKLPSGRILMGRPGCGFGHLDWLEVEPLLKHYLVSDRFIVFHKL